MRKEMIEKIENEQERILQIYEAGGSRALRGDQKARCRGQMGMRGRDVGRGGL